MRENIGFIIACGLLWAMVFAVGYIGDSGAGFLPSLLLVPVTLIGLVALLAVAVIQLFLRTQLPLSKRMIPLWFATVPVLTYAAVRTGLREIEEQNTWLTIRHYDFHGSTNFRFSRDGEYKSWRDSPLGSSAEESGRYARQDSILTMHPELKGGQGQPFKLVIHPYSALKKSPPNSAITLTSLDTTARGY